MALVDLDKPPRWFEAQGKDHMSADAARTFATTDGVHAGFAAAVPPEQQWLLPSARLADLLARPQARCSC